VRISNDIRNVKKKKTHTHSGRSQEHPEHRRAKHFSVEKFSRLRETEVSQHDGLNSSPREDLENVKVAFLDEDVRDILVNEMGMTELSCNESKEREITWALQMYTGGLRKARGRKYLAASSAAP
jgi:hypothetical protein